jgi:GT2 family glycosyltransferase
VQADLPTAAAARNAGAARAKAPVLVFVDDGLVPSPGFAAAHRRAHDDRTPRVVLANVESHGVPPSNFVRGWLELRDRERSEMIAAPGRRFRHSDVSASHLSITASTFRELGGFVDELPAREDLEFGARVLEAGIDVVRAPDATVISDGSADLDTWIARCTNEGRADVMLLRRGTHLSHLMHAAQTRTWERALRRSAYVAPYIPRTVLSASRVLMPVLDAIRQRALAVRLLETVNFVAYWHGVSCEVDCHAELVQLLRTARPLDWLEEPAICVDLADGVSAAEARLDRLRPHAAEIRLGDGHVGRLPAMAFAERLRGKHLRAALAGELAGPLLTALLDGGDATNAEIAALQAAARQAGALARPARAGR